MQESLRRVDFEGLFSSCFARHSSMAAPLGFPFSDSLVIQFEMELFRLSVSRLVSLSQNFEEKTLIFHFVRSSYFPFKVARPSIFVGTPSFFESLILKQIDRYCKNIITHVLHID